MVLISASKINPNKLSFQRFVDKLQAASESENMINR
jgi:hypothetical protein